MSLNIRNGASSHIDSDQPGNPSNGILLRTLSLNVLFYVHWLLRTIFRHSRRAEDSGDVEKGEIVQAEANELEELGAGPIIGNQTVTEEESGPDDGEIQAQNAELALDIINENRTTFEETRDDEVAMLGQGRELEMETITGSQNLLEDNRYVEAGQAEANPLEQYPADSSPVQLPNMGNQTVGEKIRDEWN